MSHIVRSSLFAALAAGMLFPANVGQAAGPYGAGTTAGYTTGAYAPASGSQLTLVSASEEMPQTADPSAVRLTDPRGSTPPTRQPTAQATTKPAATKPAPQATARSAYKKPATAPTAKKPAPRGPAPAPRYVERQPAPSYYPQRGNPQHSGVLLAARVAVDPTVPGRPETVMRPNEPPTMATTPPPSPEVEEAMADGPMPECGPSCGPSCSSCCSSCGFCVGMEYLLLRPHFNDDEAFEQLTTTTTVTTATQTNTLVNFNEPYSSDYHFFLGYHTACGDEFRVGFWHIADVGNQSGAVTGDFLAGAGTAFQAPGGTELTIAGETINATSHLTLNMYDIVDRKRVDLPSFGCNCCPEWEVHWTYGVRIIDFRHTVDTFDPIETIYNTADFVGAGPMLGIEVRRQIGHSKVSAYVSATGAMLLGEQRGSSTATTPGLQTAILTTAANAERKIPDVNVSIGLEWQPCCHATITGGWMFEDFGDLGAPTCIGCNAPTGTLGSGDLSFDGLFLRGQYCF